MAPLIHNLGTRWRQMINIMLRPIYPREENAVGHRTGGWVNPRGHLGVLEKAEDSRF
jgi:hypothetical protein